MNSHSSYQSTNQNWIGDIPSHWSIKRLKYLTKVRKELSEHGTEELLSVTETRGIVKRKELRNVEENVSRSENLSGYRIVQKGDLVNNIMLVWKRGLGVSQYEGIVSPAYSVFSFNSDCDPNFFNYLLRSDEYISEFRRHSTGIIMSRLRLYDDSFGNVFAHLPPIEEQNLSSRYLDKKTSQIDSLVDKIQKKIDLLKEQRTSLINHYVTKGLNPNVEMKDSDVEWIGEIPKHWSIVRLRFLCEIKTGGKDTQDNVENGDYPFFVRSPNVKRINSYSFDGEAVLTSGDGAGVGKIFHHYIGKFDYHQRVYKFSNFRGISGKFFYWFLKENFHYEILRWNAKSTVDSVRLPFLQNFPMLLPPIKEQKDILLKIDSIDDRVEKLTQVLIKKIETLNEYRQSLISYVVTGKVRVTEDMI